jgi:RimJ/RimL family protein N-acetyltransferase
VSVSVPILDTVRLRLRPWRDDDLEAYAAMNADPETMRYIGRGDTLSRADAWRSMAMLVGHWQLRGFGTWAVEERDTGTFVGRVGLHYPEGWPGLEVGWMLDRATRGRGYATEAARASLEYAWRTLDVDHVISLIQPENAASIRVAERIGEAREGTIELDGVEALVYGIDRPAGARR